MQVDACEELSSFLIGRPLQARPPSGTELTSVEKKGLGVRACMGGVGCRGVYAWVSMR